MTIEYLYQELVHHRFLYSGDNSIEVEDHKITNLKSSPRGITIEVEPTDPINPEEQDLKTIRRIIEGLRKEQIEDILVEVGIDSLIDHYNYLAEDSVELKILAKDIWAGLSEEFFLKALNYYHHEPK